MVDIPRHLSQHDRAAALRLVTDSGTVTAHQAMDRSRNRAVLDAIEDRLSNIKGAPGLRSVKRGADYDWGRLDDRLREAGVARSRRQEIIRLAERFERPYPSLLRLRVDPHTHIDFAPGQYVTLRAHGTPRAYSLANTPEESELEFAIRRVPGGRLTEDLFTNVDVGDEVVVRGPNGDMVLHDPTPRDEVFLATGTGVAPFKSMIDHLFGEQLDTVQRRQRDVWLFLGCAWADDLPYREHFQQLDADRPNFHFVPTLTREPLFDDWNGETDYVQQVFVKYLTEGALDGVSLPAALAPYRNAAPRADIDEQIEPKRTNLYACGVTMMVQQLVAAARSVGVPASQLQFEGFG